ncbi:e3 ubiquitin-protein ligase amfr-like [Lichtheimia corymbifera JMRC:FSU:9682]|uniref:E3 ubiquitin-protein ligase amfr-like n=1 Tax=Lichtheimia corymbifera JMRC:FSU:9682 TaxID=1263082 RepID=A0A068RT55_9FUNG|nr:e3 ubiquitin-protein ligase amfr-like [Lichtheimia corymbifera JMRC:FSU:9682]
MRCDLPTYVFTSLVLFAAAFTVSLQSFIDSELWHSVKECYGVHTDLDLPDATDQLRFNWHTSIPALGYNRQFPAMSCSGYISAFFTSIETQKLSLLIHINMAVCCFVLLGKIVIKLFFGGLLPVESQHIYDRMLNFLLFKVIFVSAIMDPVWIHIVRLSIWISVLGFLRIFSLLSRDRFDHLATMPYLPVAEYRKVTALLCIILICNLGWFAASYVLFPTSITFLTLEFLPVLLDTLQVMTKYFSQLLDQWREHGFESKRAVNYYIELSTDMLVMALTLVQYLQILWSHGISFGLVDIVLFLNVRSVLRNLYRKGMVHRDRWRAMSYVRNRYVDATPTELMMRNDDCAICREKMKTAKKLACGHLFHVHCLHSWIQHHVSKPTCPTCRRSLSPPATVGAQT